MCIPPFACSACSAKANHKHAIGFQRRMPICVSHPLVKDRALNHNDLRVTFGVLALSAAFARDQMRWLAHISRMQPHTLVSSSSLTAPFRMGSFNGLRRPLEDVYLKIDLDGPK